MFDSYCYPMNCMDEQERREFDELGRKAHTTEEIQGYVKVVEALFSLPEGVLSKKMKKKINGHSVAELRKAAAFHFSRHSSVSYGQLAPFFGLRNQSSVSCCVQAAKEHIEVGDAVFGRYYSMIKKIAV